MKKVGRPAHSEIRQNIVEILAYMGEGYAYSIYKIYREVFPPVTMRSIYYHLKKGLTLGEFKVTRTEKERGDYSWGGEAEKIYYTLGTCASPKQMPRIKDVFVGKANALPDDRNPLSQPPHDA
ncbi:hypothetical protein HY639_02955 [Candidatus Woesearchaeota archaeon]|nr:hypothetical protein [Candidatus Woesearchaeota archaeon]